MKELLEEFETKAVKTEIYLMRADGDARRFYADLGHIFASPEIRRDMDGYPVSNIEHRGWIVAFRKGGPEVVAFRSFDVDPDSKVATYRDAWVDEPYRQNGIYNHLLDLTEHHLSLNLVKRIKAIGNPKAAPILQKHGFVVTSMRGRFAYLEKEIERDA